MARTSLRRHAVAVAAVLLSGAFAFSSLGSASAQQPDEALFQAAAAYVEDRGEQWAGLCDQTNLDQHIGMWCTEVESISGGTAVLRFGETFSQFQVSVTFERANGTWQAVGESAIPPPGGPSNGAVEQYTVQPGDTLFSIAQRFGVTVDGLVQRNNIDDANLILPGQVLLIHGTETETELEYTVQPGDTLFSVAQRFSVPMADIVARNSIVNPSLILAGQVLIIPESTVEPPVGPEVAVCLQGNDFVEDGPIAAFDRQPADASRGAEFRFAQHDGCERLVIDLATDTGELAVAPGPVEADLLRDLGVIRIHLGDEFGLEAFIDGPTEATFDGGLMDRAYVVRSIEGGFFIDVHLAQAALARVLLLESPARIVIDVHPGGAALEDPPGAFSDNVVVLTPRADAQEEYPLVIRGYARTFEANVLALIRSNDGIDVEEFTTAASWLEAWGQYELTIEDGPDGEVELFVGERSARDGSEIGERIDLTLQ